MSRDTIGKMCRFSVPPGYVRSKPPEKPKLGALIPVIDAILEADKTAPPKQRHTAKRIFERRRDEHGFSGGYTVVKDHVRLARTRNRETFVPLSHLPAHAQVDFGESVGVIGGMRMKLHVFCFALTADTTVFRDLPAVPFEPCEKRASKVSSTALVRYRSNDYSVPTAFGFRDVLVKGFVDEVVIVCSAEVVARHPRLYGGGEFAFDPRHYLALIERKPGSLDQAAPLQGWTSCQHKASHSRP